MEQGAFSKSIETLGIPREMLSMLGQAGEKHRKHHQQIGRVLWRWARPLDRRSRFGTRCGTLFLWSAPDAGALADRQNSRALWCWDGRLGASEAAGDLDLANDTSQLRASKYHSATAKES